MFRQLNARKAKYGFEQFVSLTTLKQIATAQDDIKDWDPESIVELDLNMTNRKFKVYTDSDVAASLFVQKYCQPT